ncbi:MAG: helix-turn-helix transcriptional regulator, partial [Pseudomonadota bacterium]
MTSRLLPATARRCAPSSRSRRRPVLPARPSEVATAADTGDSSAPKQSAQPSAGERLRVAREKADMSLRDAARLLNLDHWMVEALENDDFAALGAPVFAKGHLKTYALLLELNPDDLMISYYDAQGAPEAPPIVGKAIPQSGRQLQLPWASIGIGLLAVGVVAAVAWWFFFREPPAAQRASAV